MGQIKHRSPFPYEKLGGSSSLPYFWSLWICHVTFVGTASHQDFHANLLLRCQSSSCRDVHGNPPDEEAKIPCFKGGNRWNPTLQETPKPWFFNIAVVKSSLLFREEGITIFSRTPEENDIILTSFSIHPMFEDPGIKGKFNGKLNSMCNVRKMIPSLKLTVRP